MANRRTSKVSLMTVAALLAMLWTFPAVWCIERDGSIQVKAAVPCTQSLPHCSGESEAEAGTDCTDVSIYVDGLTRAHQRPALGHEVSPHMLAATAVTGCPFSRGTVTKTSSLAYVDRSTFPAGPDLTIVLII